MRKFLLVPLVLLVYLLAGGPTASAHNGKQSYVYVSLYDTQIDGRVEIPAADLGEVLGFDAGTTAEAIAASAAANEDAIIDYLAAHLALGESVAAPWPIAFGAITVLDRGPQSYLLIQYEVTTEFDATPRTFEVEYDAIIEANPEKDALLHIENDVRSATLSNESEALLGFSVGQTVQVVSVDTASTLEQVAVVRGAGTDAVRGGAVHALFVLVLMAPIALLARGRGFTDPAPTVRAIASRAGLILVAFAGGHLVTLWLTGLGVIDVPSRAVVALSATSLLAISLWVVATWQRPSLTGRDIPVVAVLGLLQGLALGERFVDDGLDRSRTLLSLVGYSIGVEVAVVIAAVLMLVPMVILRRTPIAPAVLVVVCAVGLGYSVAWIMQGLLDADWSLQRIENPWRVWPRSLILAILFSLAAVGVRAIFAARDQLRPVGPAPEPSDEPVDVPEEVLSR